MKTESSEIISRFEKKGIPREMYWLGPVEGADMINGLCYDSGKWMIYYRERGQLSDREYYDSQDEAINALEDRLLKILEFYKRFYSVKSDQ